MLSMYISVHFFTIQHTLYSFHMAYFLLVCVVSKSMNYATIGASYGFFAKSKCSTWAGKIGITVENFNESSSIFVVP